MSVGPCTMPDMRIRTLAGPPLPHEIARDTMRAIVLAHATWEVPEGEECVDLVIDPAAESGLLP